MTAMMDERYDFALGETEMDGLVAGVGYFGNVIDTTIDWLGRLGGYECRQHQASSGLLRLPH